MIFKINTANQIRQRGWWFIFHQINYNE